MKIEFDEALHSEHADPMDDQIAEFPFGALDGEQPTEDRSSGAIAFFLWLRGRTDEFTEQAAIRCRMRLDALLWAMRPSYFDGTPSLTTLAKRMGVDESSLSRITAQIERKFGVKNRASAHGDGARKDHGDPRNN